MYVEIRRTSKYLTSSFILRPQNTYEELDNTKNEPESSVLSCEALATCGKSVKVDKSLLSLKIFLWMQVCTILRILDIMISSRMIILATVMFSTATDLSHVIFVTERERMREAKLDVQQG